MKECGENRRSFQTWVLSTGDGSILVETEGRGVNGMHLRTLCEGFAVCAGEFGKPIWAERKGELAERAREWNSAMRAMHLPRCRVKPMRLAVSLEGGEP